MTHNAHLNLRLARRLSERLSERLTKGLSKGLAKRFPQRFPQRSSERFLQRGGAGWTLIELLIALTIVTILLLLAQPSFKHLIDQQRIDTAARDLLGSIMLTRSEAIRRDKRVDLAPIDGVDWRNGWSIFVDSDDLDSSATEKKIIQLHTSLAQHLTVTTALHDHATPYIAYASNGRSRTHANSQVPQVGHLELALGNQRRRIILNFIGRPRLCNPANDIGCA